jgi:hypothetical protein
MAGPSQGRDGVRRRYPMNVALVPAHMSRRAGEVWKCIRPLAGRGAEATRLLGAASAIDP